MDAGELTINSDGSSRIQFAGGTRSSTYSLVFCRFSGPISASCPQVTTFTTDADGAASAAFTYTSPGIFMGAFAVVRNGAVEFNVAWNYRTANGNLQAFVFPAASVTGGLGNGWTAGSDSLSSGNASFGGGTLHIDVLGAPANTTYGITGCQNGGGSGCFSLGSLTTNSSGSGSVDVPVAALGIDVVALDRMVNATDLVEYVVAFRSQ